MNWLKRWWRRFCRQGQVEGRVPPTVTPTPEEVAKYIATGYASPDEMRELMDRISPEVKLPPKQKVSPRPTPAPKPKPKLTVVPPRSAEPGVVEPKVYYGGDPAPIVVDDICTGTVGGVPYEQAAEGKGGEFDGGGASGNWDPAPSPAPDNSSGSDSGSSGGSDSFGGGGGSDSFGGGGGGGSDV